MPDTDNRSFSQSTSSGLSRSRKVIIGFAVIVAAVAVSNRVLMAVHSANTVKQVKAAVGDVAQGLKNAKEVTVDGSIYLFANGMEFVDTGFTRVYTGGEWYEKDSAALQSGVGGPLGQWYKMAPCATEPNDDVGDIFFGPDAAQDLSLSSHAGGQRLSFNDFLNGTSYLQLARDNHISAIVINGLDTGPVRYVVSYNQPVSLPTITVASSKTYAGACELVSTPRPIGKGIHGELQGVVNEW